jgi:hypothetical protein
MLSCLICIITAGEFSILVSMLIPWSEVGWFVAGGNPGWNRWVCWHSQQVRFVTRKFLKLFLACLILWVTYLQEKCCREFFVDWRWNCILWDEKGTSANWLAFLLYFPVGISCYVFWQSCRIRVNPVGKPLLAVSQPMPTGMHMHIPGPLCTLVHIIL